MLLCVCVLEQTVCLESEKEAGTRVFRLESDKGASLSLFLPSCACTPAPSPPHPPHEDAIQREHSFARKARPKQTVQSRQPPPPPNFNPHAPRAPCPGRPDGRRQRWRE